MPEPLLETRSLTKRFGGLTVVDDVSLTVRPGEIHAVIGPNGAGKTSLIGLISGTLRADAGAVILGGRDVTHLPLPQRARLGLGRCFQITSIIPGLTALENVALAVQARDGSSFRFLRPAAADRRLNDAARAVLDKVGLDDRACIMAGALSHGEKRRLELAVTLARRPRLLLLDEPLAGAGADDTGRLIALLASLRKNFGTLLVEHDMRAVFALANRISVLVQGRLLITGDAEAVRNHAGVQSAYLGEDALA